ncbi:hypothetical protein OO013_17665 [Mangrovivirga sp. M17]|uniref:Lipoprotein n=1 Tax=Mangrovivirga halotolerans TaxID=2993936 RepID=A0ABT3RVD5_9BACT|nr:hypothetical protein [Mangrovivirga halotolerans]MCX2745715.1 hypothetical protein [Mangrovivirga halotolerans]
MKQVKLIFLSIFLILGCQQEEKVLTTSVVLSDISDFELDGMLKESGWRNQQWYEVPGRKKDLLKFKIGKIEDGLALYFRIDDNKLISTHKVNKKKCDDLLQLIISGKNKEKQVIDIFPGGYIIDNNLESDHPAYLKSSQWNESFDNEIFVKTKLDSLTNFEFIWTDSDTENCKKKRLITAKSVQIDLINRTKQ